MKDLDLDWYQDCSAIFTRFCLFCIRPRYQVSVYKTICPLVLSNWIKVIEKQ